jgi:hypothetical protein
MKIDWFVKTLLFTVAVFLGILALRPVLFPPAVSAQPTRSLSVLH